jgi:predicted DCC family thiol-disulfide oxidoreductase YuxK
MWTLLIAILVITGALAILDAPARARRHAAERALVLRALARSGNAGTEAGVARELEGRAASHASTRIARAQLTALEEDGAVSAFWSGTGANRSRRYRLLVEGPFDEASCTPPGGGALTVYHDGGCALCATEIALYRRAKGAAGLTFVDAAADDAGGRLAHDLPQAAALARFHVRDETGRLVSGAEAFALLWSSLPGWRWLGRIVSTPFVLPIAERAYRAFLPLRPHLARLLLRLGVIRSGGESGGTGSKRTGGLMQR